MVISSSIFGFWITFGFWAKVKALTATAEKSVVWQRHRLPKLNQTKEFGLFEQIFFLSRQCYWFQSQSEDASRHYQAVGQRTVGQSIQ